MSEVGRSTPPAVIGLLASLLLVARRFGMLGGTTARVSGAYTNTANLARGARAGSTTRGPANKALGLRD